MPNLELEPLHDLSTFRKLALGTWRTAGDPSVYGSLELRVDDALAYLDALRAATGQRVTINHLMARAAAAVFERVPEANAILRRGRLERRRTIGVFFQVAIPSASTGKLDLSGATIHDPQHKSLLAIAAELEQQFAAARADREGALASVRHLFARLPQPLVPAVLRLSELASYTLNLDLRRLGIPRDAFGSVMITNVGTLGLDEAYVPLVPYSRVPILLALGAIREVPVASDGVVTTARVMKVCATLDHRVVDGAHAAIMARTLRAWIEHPVEHFGPVPQRSLDA
jgi:pyruvate dehydrogenase E2 component (dihydrolipoamide acetyltransferase)